MSYQCIVSGFDVCVCVIPILPNICAWVDVCVCAGWQPAGSVWGLQAGINQIVDSEATKPKPGSDYQKDW